MGRPANYHFSNTCRRCVNQKHHLDLRSTDCYYWPYPAQCRECGEVCNIVIGITFLAKVKLRFHRRLGSDKREE